VKVTNLALIARLECYHGAIASRGRTSIEGWFDVEVGQNGRLTRQCVAESRRPLPSSQPRAGRNAE
jgi:hypothetical protein